MARKKKEPLKQISFSGRIKPSVGFFKSDWPMIICVAMVICMMIYTVLNHAKSKPDTPQTMYAAALKQARGIQEWRPGQGSQPLFSKLAATATKRPAWQSLYSCPVHGSQMPVFKNDAVPRCPICNQNMMVNQ